VVDVPSIRQLCSENVPGLTRFAGRNKLRGQQNTEAARGVGDGGPRAEGEAVDAGLRSGQHHTHVRYAVCVRHLETLSALSTCDRLREAGSARAEDAQGTPTQSDSSPSTLEYAHTNCITRCRAAFRSAPHARPLRRLRPSPENAVLTYINDVYTYIHCAYVFYTVSTTRPAPRARPLRRLRPSPAPTRRLVSDVDCRPTFGRQLQALERE